ncbi:uncharacterized protein [Cherax quadricarinatus]|uniref:uncharacterized protein n=1 Tax=Cherax quadricarinatus TaxID=27406 RepID=UPI00387EE79F
MACFYSVLKAEVGELKEEVLLLQEEIRRLKVHLNGPGRECEVVGDVGNEASSSEVQSVSHCEEAVGGVVATATSSEVQPSTCYKWRVVHSNGRRIRVRKVKSADLKVGNRFSVLQDECTSVASEGKGTTAPANEGKRILVVGDSQVRYVDRAFCNRNKKMRDRVCFPGAGVGDIVNRLDNIMSGNGNKPIICLSAGGNDIGKGRREELLDKYRSAIDFIKSKGGIPIICSILPRRGVGNEWLSRAIGVNCWLDRYCKELAIPFIDNWNNFYGKHDMYARDGVHLSGAGVVALADSIEKAIGEMPMILN